MMLLFAMMLQAAMTLTGPYLLVYPQGISVDPDGTEYTLQATSSYYVLLRTPNGCKVNRETGQTKCGPTPTGVTAVVQ